MIKGFYTAAASMLAQMMRQQVTANNLANANTVGYKQDRVALRNFPTQLIQRQGENDLDLLGRGLSAALGEIGTGVQIDPPLTDHQAGPLRATGQDLDLAVVGPGFFQIQTPQGVLYTRDGHFSRDAQGQILTAHGDVVLGRDGPMVVPPGRLTVAEDGTIAANGQAVGQVALVEFADPTRLQKVGNNLFSGEAGEPPAAAGASRVQQGFLEQANVDLGQNMVDMVSALRLYEASQRILQIQDQVLGQAVNEVGRVR